MGGDMGGWSRPSHQSEYGHLGYLGSFWLSFKLTLSTLVSGDGAGVVENLTLTAAYSSTRGWQLAPAYLQGQQRSYDRVQHQTDILLSIKGKSDPLSMV